VASNLRKKQRKRERGRNGKKKHAAGVATSCAGLERGKVGKAVDATGENASLEKGVYPTKRLSGAKRGAVGARNRRRSPGIKERRGDRGKDGVQGGPTGGGRRQKRVIDSHTKRKTQYAEVRASGIERAERVR